MEQQLFIHVGFPKCGSTYLQEVIFPHHPSIEYLGKRNPIDSEQPSVAERLKRALFPSYKYTHPRGKDPPLKFVEIHVEKIKSLKSPKWISNIYLMPPLYWDENETKTQFKEITKYSEKPVLCFSDEGLLGDPIHHPHFALQECCPVATIMALCKNLNHLEKSACNDQIHLCYVCGEWWVSQTFPYAKFQ